MAAACAVLLAACACRAQDLRYLRQQAWSTEEGLPQSSVHAIAQTADGYLWVATEGGLARFDGERFKVFSAAEESAFRSDDLCCLAQGAGDELWVGTADGVVRLKKGGFQRYGVESGLPSSTVLSLVSDRAGEVEVQTEDGWAQWAHGRFERLSRAPAAFGALQGTDGRQWRNTAQAVSVSGDGAGRVWAAGRQLPEGRVQTVNVDREGVAWVGMNSGLYLLRAANEQAIQVPELQGSSVLSVFEDAEGDHWVGTETSGLHVLRRLKFRTEPGLADVAVTSVAETRDGAMWVGTREDGLRRVVGGVVQVPSANARLTSSVIQCMAPDAAGGLWVGTPDGLSYIGVDAKRNVVRQITAADGLPDNSIRALSAASDGSVWAGTRQGLVHVEAMGSRAGLSPVIKTLTSMDGLGGDMIGALLLVEKDADAARRGLWVGTSGGLSLVREDGTVTNYTVRDGLASIIVTAMAQDAAGDLWVGTRGGGLSLLQGGRFVAVPAFRPGSREGDVEGIVADGLGELWFRMERGVRRISLRTLHACVVNGRCNQDGDWGAVGATYGVADGLPNDEVVAGGASQPWLAANGDLWFPTRGGVAIANVRQKERNSVAPPVVVERFLVDDAAQRLDRTQVQIPYGQARYTMEYAGLSFTVPSELRYRFRLEGFDKGWTYAGAKRQATYTNLPPGAYRFRVEAMNEDGVQSSAGAELSFKIVPPFYRRWWFVVFVALGLGALIAWLYRLRLRRLRGRFDAVLAERSRMAREIHDTLTQDFVGASLQLDLISQQLSKGKVEMAAEQVKRTRQLVSEGLDEARRSIWELRANNAQDSLPTRLTRLVEREQFAALGADGKGPKLHLSGAYRELEPRLERELLRIAQEALVNALHHAGAAEATVGLHYSSDALMLTVEDSGVGFAVDEGVKKAGHYGLVGMRERAALIDGVLEIESERGRGTRITLRVQTGRDAR